MGVTPTPVAAISGSVTPSPTSLGVANTVIGSAYHPQTAGVLGSPMIQAPLIGGAVPNVGGGILGAHADVDISKAKRDGDDVKVRETIKQHVPTYGATSIPPSYADEIKHTTVQATPTKTVAMPDGTLEQVQTGPAESIKTRVHSIQRNYVPYQNALKDHMQMPGVVDDQLQPLQKVVTSMRPVVDAPPNEMTPVAPAVHVIQELDTKYIPNVLDFPSNAGGSVDAPTLNNGVPLPRGPTVRMTGASVPKFGKLEDLRPELPALGTMMSVRAPVTGRSPDLDAAAGMQAMPYPAGPIMGFPDKRLLPVKPEPVAWTQKMPLDKVEHNLAMPGATPMSPALQLAYGESVKLASKYGKYLNAEMEQDMIPDANGNTHNPITRLIHNVQKQRIVCKNDTDCSGHGRCNPDGSCLCNNDWLGPYCSDMDVIKLNKRCFQHPSCQHCIRDQTCGWAANLRRCMFGMVDGPEANVFDKNITQWDFQYCSGEPCRSYLTCEACTADPLCVYCPQPVPLQTNIKTLPTGACIEGDSRGPLYHCPNDMSVWPYYGRGKCPSVSVPRMRGSPVNKGDKFMEGAVHYDTIYGPLDIPQKEVHPDGEVEEDEKEAAKKDAKEEAEVSDKPTASADNSTTASNGTVGVPENKPEAQEEASAPDNTDKVEPEGADAAAKEAEDKKKEEESNEAEKPAADKEEAEAKGSVSTSK